MKKTNKLYLFIIITFLLLNGCAKKQTVTQLPPADKPEIIETGNNYQKEKERKVTLYKRHEKINATKKSVQENIWNRLFALYALPDVSNARVREEKLRFLRNPKYLQTIQERAEPYLYAIIEAIEAKKLPGELALLPVVESGFQPKALSSSKAAGLWQFIPSTGRYFGLEQNWWYDGRQDIQASTDVATNYLKDLNDFFHGDWFLALASYNAGKGTVLKAIKANRKKNKATDYWSLTELSTETKKYVPRLLAVAHIFANARQYNVALKPIPNKPVYTSVDVGSQLDLLVASQLATTPFEEFISLNPGYKQRCTAPNGPHKLLIPVDKAEAFQMGLANLSIEQRMLIQPKAPTAKHMVKRGETLSSIARKYETSVKQIQYLNHLKTTNIQLGWILKVPGKNKLNAYLQGKPFKNKQSKYKTYIVRKGDSLWKISRKFSVSPSHIIRWNGLSKNATLHPGQKLIIKSV